ncbi:hypothetical protein RRG08_059935 [Elysia crispata]|uniref:Uncharacterized protein n=1 Tax=Elysia crispata TaxID=231223 RepID=A0AAE1CTD5_9GAST|nr:hypothetical protein RRG08_059935 [Elysia crispata]
MGTTVEKVKCYRKNVEIQYTSVVTPVIASPWRPHIKTEVNWPRYTACGAPLGLSGSYPALSSSHSTLHTPHRPENDVTSSSQTSRSLY